MNSVSRDEAAKVVKEIAENHKRAEHYLLYYQNELSDYRAARQAYITRYSGKAETSGKNPTERAALRGIDFDKEYKPFLWLQAVEIVEHSLPEKKQILLKIRREVVRLHGNGFASGRSGWVVQTQQKFAAVMERQLQPDFWIAERTLHAWWHEIITKTSEVHTMIESKKY